MIRHIIQARPVVTGAVLILVGAFFAVAGSWLLALGGSWYYAVAGVGMIASGILLVRGRRSGVTTYGAVWLFTLIWAFWESGLDIWYLMPRSSASGS